MSILENFITENVTQVNESNRKTLSLNWSLRE